MAQALTDRFMVATGFRDPQVYSLQAYPAQYLAAAYRYAREDAADETGRPLATFPEACPWAVERVLDADFWPEM
jgi:hypothetical protein